MVWLRRPCRLATRHRGGRFCISRCRSSSGRGRWARGRRPREVPWTPATC